MKKNALNIFSCPKCEGSIVLLSTMSANPYGDVKEGLLMCKNCESEFPIKNHIPRFVTPKNYAFSFGFQWNKHAKTQIDKFSGINLSRDRFFHVTQWSNNLKGQKMLEAGCGAGRFTQIAIRTGAEVFSFDYSDAVDINLANNGFHDNLHIFQADIYRIPFQKASFDKIFCFGVLQHCPAPREAFMNLIPYLKYGGEIAIDVYDLTFRTFANPKYWLRPFTKSLAPEKLYNLVQKLVPKLFPIKMWVTENIPFGKYFAFFIPIAYHKGFLPYVEKITYEELLEFSILDTFDKFAPKYDKPQRINSVKNWFIEAGLKNIKVNYGPNGINGKGVKQ